MRKAFVVYCFDGEQTILAGVCDNEEDAQELTPVWGCYVETGVNEVYENGVNMDNCRYKSPDGAFVSYNEICDITDISYEEPW